MRKRTVLLCLILFFFSSTQAFAISVTRVIDGDTVVLSTGEHMRLIGVDTPELHVSAKLKKDSKESGKSKEEIQAMGEKASKFTSDLLLNQEVKVLYESNKRDRYGRTLGYLLVMKKKVIANEEIIKRGYGCAYTKYKFKMKAQFVRTQVEAKRYQRGLWPEIDCKQ